MAQAADIFNTAMFFDYVARKEVEDHAPANVKKKRAQDDAQLADAVHPGG